MLSECNATGCEGVVAEKGVRVAATTDGMSAHDCSTNKADQS
jgi:hypothetical protein